MTISTPAQLEAGFSAYLQFWSGLPENRPARTVVGRAAGTKFSQQPAFAHKVCADRCVHAMPCPFRL